ncbi:hypothetical protein MAP00_000987 [Monascus purpureus]|nr:hypothetical protein MAP00_000987 [Monascus purpureus]
MGSNATHPDNARSITRNLRNLKVAAPLRSRYLYCNQMFTVATHLVEETSKKSFSDFLDERIFAPLNMNSTTLQPASAHAKGWGDRMAKGYIWENNAWRGFHPQNCPEGQGAGSVISSAKDLIKWVKALLYHEGPINDRVYQGLTKMRSIVNPNARRLKAHTTPAIYTAGMEMYFYRGNMVIGHDGNSAGAGGAATAIMRALMDEVLGVPIEERPSQNNNKRRDIEPKKDLAIQTKVPHQDQKEHQLKDRYPGLSKEQPSEDAQAEPKDEPQGHTSNDGQTKKTAKKEKNKGTQQPQRQKKQGGKLKKRDRSLPPQETPPEAYVGRYWNAGYHTMMVQIKDDRLFIDATDRSMGFTMTFEHVKDQTKYIAHLKDDIELTDDPVDAEFVFEDGKAVKMGLDLEPAIKDMIWFTRHNDGCK